MQLLVQIMVSVWTEQRSFGLHYEKIFKIRLLKHHYMPPYIALI